MDITKETTIEKECDNCGKLTSNPRFCSRSCAAQVTNKETPKRRTKKLCSKCDNKVRNYRSSLCEEHFKEWKSGFKDYKTIGEYREVLSVKGKHLSWLHAHVRNFARSWNKHLSNLPCANCGYDLHVELAHIIPVSSFEDSALLSEVNSEKNLLQLCRNCHWEFDHNVNSDKFIKILNSLDKNLPLWYSAKY